MVYTLRVYLTFFFPRRAGIQSSLQAAEAGQATPDTKPIDATNPLDVQSQSLLHFRTISASRARQPPRTGPPREATTPAADLRRSSLAKLQKVTNSSVSNMPVDLANDQEVSSYLRDKLRTFEVTPGLEIPDVTPLLMDPEAFQVAIDALKRRYEDQQITHVVSCESRGFIFGAPLALALKVPFVPVRRARRLPGKTVGVDYTSGFYSGRMEMHEDAMSKGARVVIIDDLVATGNTLKVTCELIEKLEGEVVECGCIVNKIRQKETLQKIPVFGLVTL